MKKTILVIVFIAIIVITIILVKINEKIGAEKEALAFNEQYEVYLNKDLYGIDVVTVMNQATDHNTKYLVEKDENGMYKQEDKHAIKVELNLIAGVDEKTGERTMVTHQMETIEKKGLDGFITNFNLTMFRCVTIDYQKETGKVNKVVFEQIEE